MAPPQTPQSAVPSSSNGSNSTAAEPSTASSVPSLAVGNPRFHGTPTWLHYGSLAIAVLGPLGMLLPPRRGLLTPQNMMLAAGGYLGINQLAHDYTGKSILQRTNERLGSMGSAVAEASSGRLPEGAERSRRLMAEAKEARRLQQQQQKEGTPAVPASSIISELNKVEQEKNKLPAWKEERLAKEKEAFAQGKGYGDLIMEQIWEVWNQGESKKQDESTASSPASDKKSGEPGSGKK